MDREDFRLRRELIGLTFDILLETGEDISVKVLFRMILKPKVFFIFKQRPI